MAISLKTVIGIPAALIGLISFALLMSPSERRKNAAQMTRQEQFVNLLDVYRIRWNGANSIQRENMRKARDTAVCNYVANATNWSGTVTHVGTYLNSQYGSLGVQIAPNIVVRTEGDLGNEGSKIARGTALFEALSRLHMGDGVTFSGRFVAGVDSCISEASLTDNGSMTEPAFIFVFTDLH